MRHSKSYSQCQISIIRKSFSLYYFSESILKVQFVSKFPPITCVSYIRMYTCTYVYMYVCTYNLMLLRITQALIGLIRNLALCTENHPLLHETIPKLWQYLNKAYQDSSRRSVPGGPPGLVVSAYTYTYACTCTVCTYVCTYVRKRK